MDKAGFNSISHTASARAVIGGLLDYQAIENSALVSDPYDFLFAQGCINSERKAQLVADAPAVSTSGSNSLESLSFGPTFHALINDLHSSDFRDVVERKFSLDLKDFQTTVSVRGRLNRSSDGYIHTDLSSKVISVLLYLNPNWRGRGGALRLLRSANIEDCAFEIEPEFGNMLIFRRSDHSWHGHRPYEGERLSVQFNWLREAGTARQYWRHRLNFLKGLKGFSR